ncbi:achain crystal structure of engineered northeast structural genomics consortium target [Stylonychia lemnae]|uniref:Achain crystal structure of engineered northeast structural genomics consortium target n=1 Tax=Stylonychia lemnae TaxID=5949 RepID=A0A078AU39_STYLE|nr:achain crystal structure of engineered northeast structural genomics consortium target [Stylonychia lemnae]|eukprot:CDW85915.1 achain crystal structure of engineered northeast structural genomics consortium target [Stylonychia lemnae]
MIVQPQLSPQDKRAAFRIRKTFNQDGIQDILDRLETIKSQDKNIPIQLNEEQIDKLRSKMRDYKKRTQHLDKRLSNENVEAEYYTSNDIRNPIQDTNWLTLQNQDIRSRQFTTDESSINMTSMDTAADYTINSINDRRIHDNNTYQNTYNVNTPLFHQKPKAKQHFLAKIKQKSQVKDQDNKNNRYSGFRMETIINKDSIIIPKLGNTPNFKASSNPLTSRNKNAISDIRHSTFDKVENKDRVNFQLSKNRQSFQRRLQELNKFQVFDIYDSKHNNSQFFTPRVQDSYKSLENLHAAKQKEDQLRFFNFVIQENIRQCSMMLENDPTILNSQDAIGQTALHLAVKLNNKKLLKLFLSYDQVISLSQVINLQDSRDRTPLFLACQRDDYDMIKILFKNKANTLIPNNRGQYPLELIRQMTVEKLTKKAKKYGLPLLIKPQKVRNISVKIQDQTNLNQIPSSLSGLNQNAFLNAQSQSNQQAVFNTTLRIN